MIFGKIRAFLFIFMFLLFNILFDNNNVAAIFVHIKLAAKQGLIAGQR